MPVTGSFVIADTGHADTHDGSTQCRHDVFVNAKPSVSCVLVAAGAVPVDLDHVEGVTRDVERRVPQLTRRHWSCSGGMPFASLHAATQAWQPMHSVPSIEQAERLGGHRLVAARLGRGWTPGPPAAAPLPASAPLRKLRRVSISHLRSLACWPSLVACPRLVRLAEVLRELGAGPDREPRRRRRARAAAPRVAPLPCSSAGRANAPAAHVLAAWRARGWAW